MGDLELVTAASAVKYPEAFRVRELEPREPTGCESCGNRLEVLQMLHVSFQMRATGRIHMEVVLVRRTESTWRGKMRKQSFDEEVDIAVVGAVFGASSG